MGTRFSDVEEFFHEEVQAKKKEFKDLKTATKHKRLGKKSVLFPSDMMSRSEKMKHRRAGTVTTTNMYKDILPIAEFEALETYEQRNRMQFWRTEFNNKEILKAMGISSKKYYDIVQALELPKAPRVDRGEKKPRKAPIKKDVAIQSNLTLDVPTVQVQEPQVQQIIVDGLNLVFQGTYTAEQIQKQLTKFSLILEDDQEEYFFEFRLMQKQPK